MDEGNADAGAIAQPGGGTTGLEAHVANLRARATEWHGIEQQKTAELLDEVRLIRRQHVAELEVLRHQLRVRDEELRIERHELSCARAARSAMEDELADARGRLRREAARRVEAERLLAELAPNAHRLARIAFGSAHATRAALQTRIKC